jgi:hypothetical protein
VEAALALRWTYPRAADQLIFADEVIDRLPAIHEALVAGEIDVPNELLIAPVTAPIMSRARDWAVCSRGPLPLWRPGRTYAGRRGCRRTTWSGRDNGNRLADDHVTRDCMDTVKACILGRCGEYLDCFVR